MIPAPHAGDFCIREDLEVLAAENLFHFLRDIRIEVTQEMPAALEEGHPHPETREELREFHRHGTAPMMETS